MFLTHHNLQGSQTQGDFTYQRKEFLTHHNLQGSQTPTHVRIFQLCFLPIIIYKVLKPSGMSLDVMFSFLPIIIYKVLKLLPK